MKQTILLLALIASLAAGGVWLTQTHPKTSPGLSADGRKILYYQSPMHPWIKSDKPGKCPICGMNLVPVYESRESTNNGLGLKLNPDSVDVANIRTAPVERRQIIHSLQVAGNISTSSRTEAWFEFTAYARDLAWLKPGQIIEITVPSAPGQIYSAAIVRPDSHSGTEMDFDAASDSTEIRAAITNPPVNPGEWDTGKPFTGLYAEGRVLVNVPDVLAVPRNAVLQPGPQPIVYLDLGNGFYERRKVKLGRVGDEFVEVLDGVDEGDKVVTSGNLLIDAEAQISQSSDN